MLSKSLLAVFRDNNATLTENPGGITSVERFDTVSSEIAAMENSAVVCPIGDMIRIETTGIDRAKFLHNFCTNNIKEMKSGDVCEAFFTDVKAKIVAHGYLLAKPNAIEILMLPGNEEAILKHLNRYIITEDVSITARDIPSTTFAIMGPATLTIIQKAKLPVPETASGSCSCTEDSSTTTMTAVWNDAPIAFVSVNATDSVETWNRLTTAGATPAGSMVFEHQRILERFPKVGTDVSDANMAPEADRIAEAICYTKGCYLGQEPIARLDAMGHVNRKLYCCMARPCPTSIPETSLPVITSVSHSSNTEFPVLVQLTVNTATGSKAILAQTPEGTVLELTITA